MNNLYLCTNCNRKFEAPRPLCEVCGIDPKKEPRFAGVIVKVEIVHYDPPSRVKGYGVGTRACDPSKAVHGGHASGEPSVVNCKACRASEAFKKAAAEDPEFLASEDEAVSVEAGVVVTSAGCCG